MIYTYDEEIPEKYYADLFFPQDTYKAFIKIFSANGVPWPLDDYLKLIGKPTTDDMAEVYQRWFNNL